MLLYLYIIDQMVLHSHINIEIHIKKDEGVEAGHVGRSWAGEGAVGMVQKDKRKVHWGGGGGGEEGATTFRGEGGKCPLNETLLKRL